MTVPLWEQLARQWALLGSPLRPSAEDVATAQAVVDASADRSRPDGRAALTALILGVTPELRSLKWPPGTRVLASDLSMAMIRGVGSGGEVVSDGDNGNRGRRGTVQADWCHLPLASASCDLAFGDASLAQLKAWRAAELLREAARVLGTDGLLVMRMFIRPDVNEQPDAVWEQLLAGQIGNFHTFKLRLLAALQTDAEVRVVDAWAYFAAKCNCPTALARKLGWPEAQVRTIEAYRGQSTVYWLPTLAEFRTMAATEFDELSCAWPAYEMGDRCPTFVLRPRARS
jgi:SAM-dependent methyltransferase